MLGRLAAAVPWENFRSLLESIFDKERKRQLWISVRSGLEQHLS